MCKCRKPIIGSPRHIHFIQVKMVDVKVLCAAKDVLSDNELQDDFN